MIQMYCTISVIAHVMTVCAWRAKCLGPCSESMFCSSCGERVEDTAAFCSSCGCRVRTVRQQAPLSADGKGHYKTYRVT